MNIYQIIPVIATEENFAPYGNLFYNMEDEVVRLEKWPKHPNGWREIEDGVGGGVTGGDFLLRWNDGKHLASNSGVKDGEYSFAHIEDSQNGSAINVTNEINYHACGSQLFYSEDSDLILFVAKIDDPDRFPDSVKPDDFTAFLVPKGVGAHINAFIYHSPPILHPSQTKATITTAQARVHSKIYYDPIRENNTVFQIIDY